MRQQAHSCFWLYSVLTEDEEKETVVGMGYSKGTPERGNSKVLAESR